MQMMSTEASRVSRNQKLYGMLDRVFLCIVLMLYIYIANSRVYGWLHVIYVKLQFIYIYIHKQRYVYVYIYIFGLHLLMFISVVCSLWPPS